MDTKEGFLSNEAIVRNVDGKSFDSHGPQDSVELGREIGFNDVVVGTVDDESFSTNDPRDSVDFGRVSCLK